MSKRSTRTQKSVTLAEAAAILEAIAPTSLAQTWDNVGLLAGDGAQPVQRGMLCIDLTPAVAREAIRAKTDLLVAYHPPIFKPIQRLTAQSPGPEAAVFACVRHGVAIYTPHTALDAAAGGTNDVIADFCGIDAREPLEYPPDPNTRECKIVVFVPAAQLDAVASAMFTAGAGRIGDYERCSYRLSGEGTFLGGTDTQPAIGRKGRYETVEEIRLETVCPQAKLPAVTRALVAAHPYEEPAFDIYTTQPRPVRGIGRVGVLPRPLALRQLARKLKRATHAPLVQVVGDPRRQVRRAMIVVGAAGSLPFQVAAPGKGDVIVTGEIRHHDALAMNRSGVAAVALGHWTSERPTLAVLARRLAAQIPACRWTVSKADCEPFQPA